MFGADGLESSWYTRCKFDCCAGCHQCGEAEALSAPPKHQCIPSCHNDTLDSCLDTAAYPGLDKVQLNRWATKCSLEVGAANLHPNPNSN